MSDEAKRAQLAQVDAEVESLAQDDDTATTAVDDTVAVELVDDDEESVTE